jgi:hypothetical protein
MDEEAGMIPEDVTAEAAERLIDAVAPMMGLTITPEQRPAVVFNLQVAIRLARACEGEGLPDHLEAAPVFEA